MKNLYASSLVLLGLSFQAKAGPAEEGMACLSRNDLRCAQSIRDELKTSHSEDVGTLQLEAMTLFYEGAYEAAVGVVERMETLSYSPHSAPYRETAHASRAMVEVVSDGTIVRHSPGLDTVLADEAVSTLQASRETYDKLFGGGPDHDIVLDVFPTASRFTAASGLPAEAVRTTGVVALSKWSRLLLTSPRALSRGYAWKDTVAHEYIHLVVAFRSGDRVPVWLQEGLAKHLEPRWRGGQTGYLSVHHQSMLASAIQSGEFVPFEKFQRSMAYLDSSEEAALAFAQVATMVHFLLNQRGDEALPILMDRVRSGETSEAVVADLAGFENFADFREGWKRFIAQLPLIEDRLASLPVVLDGEGSDFAEDPLLSVRADLARFVRVGDLLREAGRPDAALIEYGKAEDPDDTPSPTLMVRQAACLEMLQRPREALAIAEKGIGLYPEFPLLQVTTGRLREATGQHNQAVPAWQAAHDLNPFNPEVQIALSRLYQMLGDEQRRQRHERYGRILATGGAVD